MNITFKEQLIKDLEECNIPFAILENIKVLINNLEYNEVLKLLWVLENKPFIKENDKHIYLLSQVIAKIEEHVYVFNDDDSDTSKDCNIND